MKIILLAAMSKELRLIKNLMVDIKDISDDNMPETFAGKIGEHDVIATRCGIGKVNSALKTMQLINEFKPDLVINSGVAGGVGNTVPGDVLVADGISYHDVWCGPGTSYGAADGLPVVMKPDIRLIALAKTLNDSDSKVLIGHICSGDKFISKPEEVKLIKDLFPDTMAVDMESASIMQTCFLAGVPCNIVRVISDTPGEGNNIDQYQNFWEIAPEKTFKLVSKLISMLN